MSEIPGWFDWHGLYRAAVERATDGSRFVELGTFFGCSASFLAREILVSGKAIHFDTWDNWQGVPADLPYHGAPSEERARLALGGLPVHVRSGDSLEAARCYADASLDLVFLDDDHTTAHVEAECEVWWPKVRPGGWMAGHDYDWPCVREGVLRWAQSAGVEVEDVRPRSWRVVR